MKRRSLIAAFAAGALVLAACAGDDDDAADEPSAEETVDGSSAESSESSSAETTEASSDGSSEASSAETTADASSEEMTAESSAEETEASSGDPADVEVPEDWPDSLVFTLTPSQEAGGLIESAEPLAVLLEERLGVEVEALVPSDYAGVIVALQSGQAQIAGGLGPSQMVQAEDTANADLILQAVRFGSSQYVTQWFTNDPDTFCGDMPKQVVDEEDGTMLSYCNGVDQAQDATDGPIGEEFIPNVAGKTVSFVDQGSTSGYLIPALALIQNGVDPLDDITAIFAGGHPASVQAVYDGDADVGVSFNDARDPETLPDVGDKVVVWGWSAPIPNDGFAVAGDLPDDLKTAITDAFVDIAATEDGAALLDALYEIDGLVPVPEGSYDIIRDLETDLSELLG